MYAMGLAVNILKHLDEKTEFSVMNTGWKDGFGLKVCERTPIKTENLLAELETDGEELEIHYISGAYESFKNIENIIQFYLNEKVT